MGTKQTSAFCPVCEKQVRAIGSSPNHGLHLLLTIFTAGLWGIVWIFVSLGKIGGYRCQSCGSKVTGTG